MARGSGPPDYQIIYRDPPDYYPNTKAVCTCPHCQIIWPHREQGRERALQQALARYDGVRRCPECGQWSRLDRRRTLWGLLGVNYRRVPCDPPEREVTADADVER